MMMGHHMIEPVIGEIAEAGFSTVNAPVHIGVPMLSTQYCFQRCENWASKWFLIWLSDMARAIPRNSTPLV